MKQLSYPSSVKARQAPPSMARTVTTEILNADTVTNCGPHAIHTSTCSSSTFATLDPLIKIFSFPLLNPDSGKSPSHSLSLIFPRNLIFKAKNS